MPPIPNPPTTAGSGPGWRIPRIRSGRLRLRPFAAADGARIVEACSNPRAQYWLNRLPRTYTLADAHAYVENCHEEARLRTGLTWCLADPDDDRCLAAIGMLVLGDDDPRSEIGYWTHPAARGGGLMTAAVALVTAYLLENGLAETLLIRCATTNTASRHVAETAGYHPTAVLPGSGRLGDGTACDQVIYVAPARHGSPDRPGAGPPSTQPRT